MKALTWYLVWELSTYALSKVGSSVSLSLKLVFNSNKLLQKNPMFAGVIWRDPFRDICVVIDRFIYHYDKFSCATYNPEVLARTSEAIVVKE